MSGFPRAGSTLLANILNQNSKLYSTPTSGLVGSVLSIKDNWKQNAIYRSNGEKYIYPKIKNMMKMMILGFYYDQIENGIIPIDKNRAWTGHVDMLNILLDSNYKIIFPVRNVVDCCISMEFVNRKGALINHGDNGNFINEQSTQGRVQNFLKDDGVFGSPILHLRDLMYRGETDNLIIVPYDDLLKQPKLMLNKIHNELNLPHFDYDFNNIKQTIVEHDLDHGFAPNTLHKIFEGKLLPPKPRNHNIYSDNDIQQLENNYKDIHDFIMKKSILV
jgi:sulfotransferase